MKASERIREIRKRTGLSQAAFAERYEIPKRTIENWETGKREPPIYLLHLLEIIADHPDLF